MKFEVKKSIRNMAKAGVLAGSLLGLSMVGQSANAASGDTDIAISFPPLIILYYYNEITLDVAAQDFADAIDVGLTCTESTANGLECSAASTVAASVTSATTGSVVADADITNGLGALDATLDFDINNAWAVRSLGTGNLNASVTDTAPGDDFTSIGTSLTSVTRSLTFGAGNVGDITFSVALDGSTTMSDTVTIAVTP